MRAADCPVAQPLERLVEQQDQGLIGHSGIADAPTGGHDGAGEQSRAVETARDIGGPEASLAGLGEIARLDLSFAEFAQQLRDAAVRPRRA